jgi:hypothetical protein
MPRTITVHWSLTADIHHLIEVTKEMYTMLLVGMIFTAETMEAQALVEMYLSPRMTSIG